MHTITIKIHDKVYSQFKWLLSKFSKDEIEIIEDDSFLNTKAYLQKELDEMNEVKGKYFTIDELEKRLDYRIPPDEDRI